jgi:hypothetical protein
MAIAKEDDRLLEVTTCALILSHWSSVRRVDLRSRLTYMTSTLAIRGTLFSLYVFGIRD